MDTFWNSRRKHRKRGIREKKYIKRLIKDTIIREIRTVFEHDEEDYYQPKRVNNFWNNNHIQYESNGDNNLSFKFWYIVNLVSNCN